MPRRSSPPGAKKRPVPHFVNADAIYFIVDAIYFIDAAIYFIGVAKMRKRPFFCAEAAR